jgi:UV DNA damage repair endonuclease
MIKRIGFACKWIDHPGQVNGIKPKDDAKKYNTGSTTVSWLNRQSKEVGEQKLWDLIEQNLTATKLLVDRVGALDENLRMVRLSSDLLPVYTHNDWSYFWRRNDVRDRCSSLFRNIGDSARANNVRLSFHPGQFCCIVSDSPDIVKRSIEELEYHADMTRWLGYGKSKLDFKLNVHLSGRRGADGFDDAWNKMSPELRNCLTLENDEFQKGIDDLLPLNNKVGIVLDIHHHHIHSGEYIEANDDRIKKIIDSWCGVRPTIHYSASREDVLTGHSRSQRPALLSLIEIGHKKAKLRAHSDFMWNDALNEWAHTHWTWADVMVEAKGKNLASTELFNQWKRI